MRCIMGTAVATWGNSEAIRIPRSKLRRVGLKNGDQVTIEVNNKGNLEIIPIRTQHRRVIPLRRLSFEELFKDYGKDPLDNRDAWLSDDLIGVEMQAWGSVK
jgi:antitoxin MazE